MFLGMLMALMLACMTHWSDAKRDAVADWFVARGYDWTDAEPGPRCVVYEDWTMRCDGEV